MLLKYYYVESGITDDREYNTNVLDNIKMLYSNKELAIKALEDVYKRKLELYKDALDVVNIVYNEEEQRVTIYEMAFQEDYQIKEIEIDILDKGICDSIEELEKIEIEKLKKRASTKDLPF